MKITELIKQGQFIITAEVSPPKGCELGLLLRDAKEHLSGVTAINVTECQSSKMRMSSLAACVALKSKGFNPIWQLTCRDRNRIALQSELLGAAALGIENLLLLTGDHTLLGDHPQAKPVFDLDSVSLIHAVRQLEMGVDLGGNALIGEPPKFAKGAVVAPCADSIDAQLFKMEKKVKAGAEFFQTQAIFESEKFIRFMDRAKQFGVPVILGLIIPKSVRQLRFLRDNLAGISIPQEMVDELGADEDKAKSGVTGVEIIARLIKECRDHCQGAHIMAFGWEAKIPAVLELIIEN